MAILPVLNGSLPDIKDITCDDGYVNVAGLLIHDDIKAGNITLGKLSPLALVQCEEHGHGQFLRKFKSRHGLTLIIYDGIL